MKPISINPEDVKNLLHNLEANKASGPDQIPFRFLKIALHILKASLHQGHLPSEWKHVTVIPVFKKETVNCHRTTVQSP